jgi:hypothetical protein
MAGGARGPSGTKHEGRLGAPHSQIRPVSKSYLSPILNIFVPQVAHTPRVAGRPFFILICSVLFIDRFCLHFMQ